MGLTQALILMGGVIAAILGIPICLEARVAWKNPRMVNWKRRCFRYTSRWRIQLVRWTRSSASIQRRMSLQVKWWTIRLVRYWRIWCVRMRLCGNRTSRRTASHLSKASLTIQRSLIQTEWSTYRRAVRTLNNARRYRSRPLMRPQTAWAISRMRTTLGAVVSRRRQINRVTRHDRSGDADSDPFLSIQLTD